MTQELPVVSVHSVAEAFLYLMTVRCPICGAGPVRESGDITKAEQNAWTLAAVCAGCNTACLARFEMIPVPTREQARSNQINPTAEPSRAIDLLGWLTLFQSIVSAAEKQTDKSAGRQLAFEAAQCLDEAMKFYDSDNEMPRAGAFFTDESKRRYREHPNQFSRSKWRQRRLMLPDSKVRTRSDDAGKRSSWWQFWRRR